MISGRRHDQSGASPAVCRRFSVLQVSHGQLGFEPHVAEAGRKHALIIVCSFNL